MIQWEYVGIDQSTYHKLHSQVGQISGDYYFFFVGLDLINYAAAGMRLLRFLMDRVERSIVLWISRRAN